MSKFEEAMKVVDKLFGGDKEVVFALSTISLTTSSEGKPRPASRMVCAYYEDGAFYVSTDARKNKMLEIAKNNEVSICGMEWYTFHGQAENLGWVKDEKNAHIREKFKKVFGWFDEVGDENNPNSIVLKIKLFEGVIIDYPEKAESIKYEIDFVNKTAK
jgi:uncharacterized pyridoxamine 5'-phosphate oxidase family protein